MVVPGLRDTTLIDDTYNASPESMLAALNLLEDLTHQAGRKSQPGQRSVAVLGDMYELGTFEEEGHRLVGGRVPKPRTWAVRVWHGKLVTVAAGRAGSRRRRLSSGMPAADVYIRRERTRMRSPSCRD